MASYLEPLIRGFGFLPALLSGLGALKQGAAFINPSRALTRSTIPSTNQKAEILEPNEKIQSIFQEILRECGLENRGYKCKIVANFYEADGVALRDIVIVSASAAHALISNDKQEQLCARSMIKHELGHLYHQDSLRKMLLSVTLTSAFYSTTKLLEYFVPSSSLFILSVRTALWARAQFKFLEKLLLATSVWREKRADDFAIEHTTNPEELLAAAKEREKSFNDHVKNAIHIEFPSYIPGQRFIEEFVHIPIPVRTSSIKEFYTQRKNKAQSFKDWIIENRNDPVIGDSNGGHPSNYDQALTFRRAAEKLAAG